MSDLATSYGTDSNESQFPYETCRNISLSESMRGNMKVYTGYAPASSFFGISDNENVRKYLLEVEGRGRNRRTAVHRDIQETIDTRVEEFPYLNGGVTLTATSIRVDDKAKILSLKSLEIINGSQTRGLLKDHYASSEKGQMTHVRFEILVTDDQDLIRDIAISRNNQNAVKDISIVGHRQQLKELHGVMHEKFPETKWTSSETDIGDGYQDTHKLLQVTFALLPDEIYWGGGTRTGAYSQKLKWLKEFAQIEADRAESGRGERRKYEPEKAEKIYKAILDLAPIAWALYGKWKNHDKYMERLRARRNESGSAILTRKNEMGEEIRMMADGMVFPIIAAYSAFICQNDSGSWVLLVNHDKEKLEENLVMTARTAYRDSAGSNAQTMGKYAPCYSTVMLVPKLLGGG